MSVKSEELNHFGECDVGGHLVAFYAGKKSSDATDLNGGGDEGIEATLGWDCQIPTFVDNVSEASR